MLKDAYELYNAKIERIVKGHWNPAEETSPYVAAPPMHPLNQILYGPPGTGKTYHTRALAVAICQNRPVAELEALGREEINRLYAELEQRGQIVFTTFHQSLGYEDFVEGIKPVETDGTISYEVRAGLLKELARRANAGKAGISIEDAYQKFINDLQELDAPLRLYTKARKAPFLVEPNSVGNLRFRSETEKRVPATITKKMLEDYLLHGVSSYWPSWTPAVGDYIKANYSLDTDQSQSEPHVLIMDEINRGNVSAIFGELITLIEDGKRAGQSEAITVTLPYSQEKFTLPANLFLVGTMNTADRSVEALDTALRRRFIFQEMMPRPELLRGGYSQEAILEIMEALCQYEDYAWEAKEWLAREAALTAAYGISHEEIDALWTSMLATTEQVFGKPIKETRHQLVGLSREKIAEVFRSQVAAYSEGALHLQNLLITLNARLTYLKDKNHTLGHAFFLNCTTAVSVVKVIAQKILPLLEEFFYGETAKIGMVLSKEFLFEGDERAKGADIFHTDGIRLARELDLDLGTRLPRRSLTGPELLAKVGEDEETALRLLNSILPRPTTHPA